MNSNSALKTCVSCETQVTTRVLLIEDSPGDMCLARRALASSDHSVHLEFAQTGSAALRLLFDAEFDLVLLDINLPDTNGLDLLASIGAISKKLSVVVLSTSKDSRDKLRARDLGCIAYLTKPSSYEEYANLARRLNDYLKAGAVL